MKIGKIEYGPAAFAVMRAISLLVNAPVTTEEERKALLHEAHIIHVFHEEFPGVVLHDDVKEQAA